MGLTEPKSRCSRVAFLLEGLAKIPFSSLFHLWKLERERDLSILIRAPLIFLLCKGEEYSQVGKRTNERARFLTPNLCSSTYAHRSSSDFSVLIDNMEMITAFNTLASHEC